MADASPDDAAALAGRVRALEAENARLSSIVEPAPASPPSPGRWRAVVSAICIVLASVLVPVSIVGAWARVQLVEEDAFVGTLAPLVDDAAVQDLVIDQAVGAISEQVDFAALTDDVFDGLAELGLPPRTGAALDLLRQPAAQGLESLLAQSVESVVRSDAFSDVWATAVRGAHRALTVASTSDGGGIVVRTEDGVGIALGPIVDRVKTDLVAQGVAVANLIPSVDRTVIIGSGQNLSLLRTAYAVATTLGWWLPVITLALFGLGVLLARRRSTAILGTGIGVALGGASLGVTLSIGANAIGIAAAQTDLSPSALDVIYRQLVDSMIHTAWVLALLGVFIAVVGWLMGRSAPARRTRAAVHSLNASARHSLARRGLDTGAFGSWLGAHRVLVRTIVAVLAVLWLFALRPLGLSDVLLVVVVAIAVAWMLELLQRREDDAVATTGSDAGAETTDAPAAASEEAGAEASGVGR